MSRHGEGETVALRTGDRPGRPQAAERDELDDGWAEIRLPPPRPTVVPSEPGLPAGAQSAPVRPAPSPSRPSERPAGPAADPLASSARIADVIALWRAEERALAGPPEGTPDWVRHRARLLELKAEHRALFHERLQAIEHDAKGSCEPLPDGWQGRSG